jgi:LacI family transcriptional regulator
MTAQLHSVGRQRRRVLIALGYHDHQLYRGIRRYASQAGWILDTSASNYGTLPAHWRGDGILTLVYPDNTALRAYLRKTHAKLVNLGDDVDLGDGKVLMDNVAIGRMAAEHLLERGLRHFAFLKFSDVADVRGRETGFTDRLAHDGFLVTTLNWPKSRKAFRDDWYAWLSRELLKLPAPVGVMAQSDNRAVCMLDACEAVGLKVPEQVALIGVDNKELVCNLAAVPLTSVDSDRERMAFEGSALLDRLMNGRPAPKGPILIPPRSVVLRKSTDTMAIDHADVRSALDMIWKRYTEPITVEDVVTANHLSRCGIYRAFEKHVGRSIGDEIKRKRLQHAQHLLAGTDEKLERIAILSGFSSGEYLSRTFHQVFGMTPSAYRKERRLAGQ